MGIYKEYSYCLLFAIFVHDEIVLAIIRLGIKKKLGKYRLMESLRCHVECYRMHKLDYL